MIVFKDLEVSLGVLWGVLWGSIEGVGDEYTGTVLYFFPISHGSSQAGMNIFKVHTFKDLGVLCSCPPAFGGSFRGCFGGPLFIF